jgi:membrane protein DedA with SNARE-associated domain
VNLAVGLDWLDPATLLTSYAGAALWIALAVIFAECGLLIGFFLPGDTLLFTVGLFVSQGLIEHPIWWVCLVLMIGAVLGNVLGYEIGRAVGAPVFDRGKGKFLNPKQVQRTSAFFERYGGPAIILARFVPVVRTFITVTAGVARMDRRVYLLYSTLGAILWVWGITLVAWRLGQVPFVQDFVQPNLDLLILGAVGISVLPVAVHLLREGHSRRRDAATVLTSDTSPIPGPVTGPVNGAAPVADTGHPGAGATSAQSGDRVPRTNA